MVQTDNDVRIPVIAAAGLSRFDCLALTVILNKGGIEAEITPVRNIAADSPAEARIVTPDVLAANIDYLLARKETTVVFCRNRPTSSPFSILTPDMDDREICEMFDSVIKAASKDDDNGGRLSTRETDVLRLIAKGLTIKEIGEKLCISANTVATHRKNISSKLGIRTISGLSLYAAMNGIIND